MARAVIFDAEATASERYPDSKRHAGAYLKGFKARVNESHRGMFCPYREGGYISAWIAGWCDGEHWHGGEIR